MPMYPTLLIHGYSSEGKDTLANQIYGSLPDDLRNRYGPQSVFDLNLSRWISLNDGIDLDDVSFAMDRALNAQYSDLLTSGFHVIIHSTGALVVRNWIRKHSLKPSPIKNLVHLAGANFGSGLAHIGQGQLARWGRLIFQGTGTGTHVMDELEFGSWKTLDMHIGYLQPGNDMYADYQVQEFCLIGSRTLDVPGIWLIPIRYIKEDSADSTVRTSACNLNFNYVRVTPTDESSKIDPASLAAIINDRLDNNPIQNDHYLSVLRATKPEVPFAVVYETAHFGDKIGIVSGTNNRDQVLSLIFASLETPPHDEDAYRKTAQIFRDANATTFVKAAQLTDLLYNPQEQYEGHAQLIFRLKDQFGNAVENFDITLNSQGAAPESNKLEDMIEDKHNNDNDKGTITFYLRTQKYDENSEAWFELLDNVAPLDVEVTGHEPTSDDIDYLPMNIRLSGEEVRAIVQSFRTTIIDIVLLRLPSNKVFDISKA